LYSGRKDLCELGKVFFANLRALDRFFQLFFESSLISKEKAKDGLKVFAKNEDESEGVGETIIALKRSVAAILIPSPQFTPSKTLYPSAHMNFTPNNTLATKGHTHYAH
jgi:hypothetical protein